MKGEVIYKYFFEFIDETNCPQCQTLLKVRWLSQEEQEKLTFDVPEPEFRNGSQLSQVEVYFCPNCDWQEPTLLVKNKEENIPASEVKQRYQKEWDLVENIVAVLLPQQHIKVRFVKDAFFGDETLYTKKAKKGVTHSFELTWPGHRKEAISVCLFINHLIKEDRTIPGTFLDVVAHELAHASLKEIYRSPGPEVFPPNCSCQTDAYINPHFGEGHDKIWHDKYDEFRERIKNENLAEGSGYVASGINFEFGKSKNDKEKRNNQYSQLPAKNEQLEKNSKIQRLFLISLIGILLLFSLVGIVFWFVFRKRVKNKV